MKLYNEELAAAVAPTRCHHQYAHIHTTPSQLSSHTMHSPLDTYQITCLPRHFTTALYPYPTQPYEEKPYNEHDKLTKSNPTPPHPIPFCPRQHTVTHRYALLERCHPVGSVESEFLLTIQSGVWRVTTFPWETKQCKQSISRRKYLRHYLAL